MAPIFAWLRIAVISAAAFLLAGGVARAQLRDSFETPTCTWLLRGANCGVRTRLQERTPRASRSGQSSEHLQLEINGVGTYAYLVQAIGRAPVIQEFRPSLFLKADRASLQLMARVVFPRSLDRGTGQPITSFLRGDFYTEVGQWQQLAVPNAAKLLEQETRTLRTQFGDVDPREAYIDLLVLNVYSAPGPIELWIDDLEIDGYVNLNDAGGPQVARRPATESNATPQNQPSGSATVQGSLLLVRNRPFMPRIVQQQGEPLEWLKSLGFNTVRLSSSPSATELKEAQRLGIWLVAPPPYNDTSLSAAALDPVIAWSLGTRLTEPDVTPTRDLIREIRGLDPQPDRPLLAGVDAGLADHSRLANLLLLERPGLATSHELADLRQWLLTRPRLAQPGTPVLASISSQRPPRLNEQLLLFSQGRPVEEDTDPQQLRWQAYQAIAAGVRGFVFPSEQPLAIDTGPAALRTDALKLLNMELKLLEPWISAGQVVEELQAADGTQISVLQTERAKLLIVTQHAPAQQYVLGPPPHSSLSLTIPSVGQADQAHLVSLEGIKPLKLAHTSGGGRITIDDAPQAVAIAITPDPLALLHLHRTQAQFRLDACRVRYDLAARRYIRTLAIDQQLTAAGHALAVAAPSLREAFGQLEQARKLLEAGDVERSHQATAKAETLLARVRRGHWEQTAAAFPSPAASPCLAQFTTLPLHWQVAERMKKNAWGPNVQVGGDMEALDGMLRAGWQQQKAASAGVQADVSLSLNDPHSGRSALKLQAWPADPSRAPRVIERPLVWVSSSPVPVREGQLVRIRCWASVPRRLGASDEGLLVFDSLGGPDLGDRIRLTQGWREVTLYRAVPRSGDLSITFALSGLGEAALDDLQVSLLDPAPIRPASASR